MHMTEITKYSYKRVDNETAQLCNNDDDEVSWCSMPWFDLRVDRNNRTCGTDLYRISK